MRGQYKMRENHVFFMNVLYPIVEDFEEKFRKDGKEIMDSLRNILMGSHLTKGFSCEVIIFSI